MPMFNAPLLSIVLSITRRVRYFIKKTLLNTSISSGASQNIVYCLFFLNIQQNGGYIIFLKSISFMDAKR